MTTLERIREYETTYIVRPDISDVDADRVIERVRKAIRENAGKVIGVNNWGKRKLAYEIQRHQKGIYVHWHYAANNSAVAEVERNLRMLEPVLRFLTVRLTDQIDIDGVAEMEDEQIPFRATGATPASQPTEGEGAEAPAAEAAPAEKATEKAAAEAAPAEEAAEAAPAEEAPAEEAPAEEAAAEAAPAEEAAEAAPAEEAAEAAPAEEAPAEEAPAEEAPAEEAAEAAPAEEAAAAEEAPAEEAPAEEAAADEATDDGDAEAPKEEG